MRTPGEHFRVAVDDSVLSDLRERLARTRWPKSAPLGPAWSHGTNPAFLRQVIA
jgi:hypothetical protein